MKTAKKVLEYIEALPEKQLIFASELFKEIEQDIECSEENFYKILERLVTSDVLSRISKGVYTRPKLTQFGQILPTAKELVEVFIANEKGMVTGYHLYYKLKLTTQISKTYQIFTNNAHHKVTIQNISIKEYRLNFTPKTQQMIAFLEVISNVEQIQDLNEKQFIHYCKIFATQQYNDEILEDILREIRYKKSTLYFLKLVLDVYQIPNTVQKYLSKLSKYKEPKVNYYEAA